MYCRNCGKDIGDSNFCPFCGTSANNPVVSENKVKKSNSEDSGSGWWGVLGFFCPIAGLILFLVWMNDRPKSSKKAGIGALIAVILSVISTILYYVLVIILVNQGILFPGGL